MSCPFVKWAFVYSNAVFSVFFVKKGEMPHTFGDCGTVKECECVEWGRKPNWDRKGLLSLVKDVARWSHLPKDCFRL